MTFSMDGSAVARGFRQFAGGAGASSSYGWRSGMDGVDGMDEVDSLTKWTEAAAPSAGFLFSTSSIPSILSMWSTPPLHHASPPTEIIRAPTAFSGG